MYSVTGLIKVIFKDIGMLSNPVEQSLLWFLIFLVFPHRLFVILFCR